MRAARVHPATLAELGREQQQRQTGSASPSPARCPRGVHPLVWMVALRAAGGDVGRLEVRGRTEVIVR